MESFLTVIEIAEMLKLNPQTVRNWIDRGELKPSASAHVVAARGFIEN
jgi:uncharacterized protein YjcR